MAVNDLTPVRLCSFDETANYVPRTANFKTLHTWMCAAAVAIGMPSKTQQNRFASCEAACGSVKEGNSSVSPAPGVKQIGHPSFTAIFGARGMV